MPLSASDDLDLVHRLQQRDETALSALYQRYGSLVYSIAYRVVENGGLAEEITQDTFLKVWNQAATWNPERGKLSTWLLTITRYAAIDRLRQEQRRPNRSAVDIDDMLNLLSAAEKDDWGDGELIRTLLGKLPADQREVIELAYFKGLSQSEMAEHLNLPLGTVKTRVRAALQRLRALWKDETGESISENPNALQ